jgi:hypothetical protein
MSKNATFASRATPSATPYAEQHFHISIAATEVLCSLFPSN